MLQEIKTIVIGIEAFTEKQSHFIKSARALDWFRDGEVKIYLVSVLNPEDLGISEMENKIWINNIKQSLLGDIRARFKTFKIHQSFEIEILFQEKFSKTQTVLDFIGFAKQKKADLLMVHCHTKSNLVAALGSFCDKLVELSSIPVLVLPFDEDISHSLKSILYPTDFSGQSKLVYKSVVRWANLFHAHLTLYHRVAKPIDEILQIIMHPIQSKIIRPEDLVLISEAEINQKSMEWISWESVGTDRVSFKMDSKKLSLTEAILSQAEEQNVDLIAMPTHTSQRNVASLGSAVKHVLRSSSIPVLIIPVPYIPPGQFSQ